MCLELTGQETDMNRIRTSRFHMDKILTSRNQHGYVQNFLKPIRAVLKPQETDIDKIRKIQASRNQHGYDQNFLKPIWAVLKPQETGIDKIRTSRFQNDKIQASRNQHRYEQNFLKPIRAVLKPQETDMDKIRTSRFHMDNIQASRNQHGKLKGSYSLISLPSEFRRPPVEDDRHRLKLKVISMASPMFLNEIYLIKAYATFHSSV
ncbi:hypothetical protein L1987_19801 [Smallanthus sonchifolius]|uniref:Uncharacterized protein n=1 Tax=Smallanthus sonchifolius TaxID=185202 RepID=A0ACB9IRR1_9ASTR|nr:hypothetical protein L1987_19801 [Smallanthus sonchifolius]